MDYVKEELEVNKHNLEIKERLVREGKSKVFADWNKVAGIDMGSFIAGLRWVQADPLVAPELRPGWSEPKMTRELGCDRAGTLHKLRRTYYADGGFAAFYDEDGSLWTGCCGPSINCRDRI